MRGAGRAASWRGAVCGGSGEPGAVHRMRCTGLRRGASGAAHLFGGIVRDLALDALLDRGREGHGERLRLRAAASSRGRQSAMGSEELSQARSACSLSGRENVPGSRGMEFTVPHGVPCPFRALKGAS